VSPDTNGTLATRLAHVALGTDDPDRLATFYGDLFGLVECARRGDVVFLSSGKTPGYELALGPWPTGLEHFALAVAGRDALTRLAERLRATGVEVAHVEPDTEHGVAEGVRFVLPSGHVVELVLASEPEAFRATPLIDRRHFAGGGPVPIEHVTLTCDDVERTASFMIEQLGLRLTESVQPPGEPWFNAFLRCRDRHHDVAFFASEDGDVPGLNHFCFAVPSVEHLVRVADLVSGHGICLDASPGRHVNGNNVFIYFKDPDGNRVEVNTDMAEIDPAAPPRVLDAMRFDAWRESIPPQVLTSSPCRDGRAAHASTDPR
jgi:catechol 2,3-dioxygenase